MAINPFLLPFWMSPFEISMVAMSQPSVPLILPVNNADSSTALGDLIYYFSTCFVAC